MAKPLGIYIHIPFCKKKCAYCDFYSAFALDKTVSAYTESLLGEIRKWGGLTDRPIDTLYFGGGTPSVLDTKSVKKLLDAVKDSFKVCENAEITFEVNPESVTFNYLKELRKCGVNRLSIGFQSADNEALKLLGRCHTKEQSIECFKNARKVGFENISLDIILAVPNTNLKTIENTLSVIKELSPEHISAYMLILEENTLFYKNQDKLIFKDEDYCADEYLLVCQALKDFGYEHYEISNFCKKGKESRHNNRYWLDEEYMGFGPSAYSFFEGKRFHYERNLQKYIKAPLPVFDETGGGLYEYIMLSLRLKRGLLKSELERLYKKTVTKGFCEKAELLRKAGLAEFDGNRLYLTDKGMLVSNSIITEITKEEFYEDI